MIEKLRAANALTSRLGTILDLPALARELVKAARELAGTERAVLLVANDSGSTLSIGAVAGSEAAASRRPFSIAHPDDPGVSAWLRGIPYDSLPGEITRQSPLYHLQQMLDMDGFFSLPLVTTGALAGVLLVDNPSTHAPVTPLARETLIAIQASAQIALANARLYSQTVAELDARMQELEMMRQLDRELTDTIQLEQVFDMTLDWALRYTLAQCATISLYSEESDDLRFVAELGYNLDLEQMLLLRSQQGGIALRVARSGRAEVIADVETDSDYVAVIRSIRSHMSVPVMREDRVIAVITIESRRLNAFTDDHLNFVGNLAARAGVAIDNARLYSEAVREREKLSHILSEIADIVVVIGNDDRTVLINQSAIAVLGISPEVQYVGLPFTSALAGTPLLPVILNAKSSGQIMVTEVQIGSERTYYAELSPHPDIGWMIVMHDITPLKETEELKRELVATVSHDLKQPLSVMNGYLELLQMTQRLDTRGDNFVSMIGRSIEHMRHLIDDLLDLAKIESGIEISAQPVFVHQLLEECIEGVKPLAESKAMQLDIDMNVELPQLAGDPSRLHQIFSNLVGNAVKYTPSQGRVRVGVERVDRNLRFIVQDNGIGISPEDQAHIFDRFYRVRRPETENIEGTGLGLAIVKKLIEAHNGQIGLESSLGEGTTFYITLPIYGMQ
ncbi:MAG: GAF domain-containing protein [Anaerolineae bacterium]|nr:GAF domain-containing protein [Anaerolineae bacterium]